CEGPGRMTAQVYSIMVKVQMEGTTPNASTALHDGYARMYAIDTFSAFQFASRTQGNGLRTHLPYAERQVRASASTRDLALSGHVHPPSRLVFQSARTFIPRTKGIP